MNQHLRPVALRGLVAASAIVTCAAAQRFSDLPMQHVPMEDVLGNTVTAGDIDGDGDVDIVFPREGSTPLVYRNQGEARFLSDSAGMPAAPLGEIRAALLVDVDADSDLDLVVLRWLARPLLWLNNAGTFTDVSAVNMPNITTQSDPTGVLAGDVDGDNDVDLFLTGNGQVLLLNNGSGVFAHAPAQLPAGIVPGGEGALVDIDTDGDLDFVGARRYWQGTGRHLLYVNNGSGVFTDQSLARLPAATHTYGGGGTVAVGDVDGDHDLDLVAPQHADNISVFRNDGTAVFSALESIPIAGVMHVPYEIFPLLLRLADFDGDGDLDLLVANGGGYGHNLFLNDGTGSFTAAPASALPQCRQVLRAQIVADVDGDGDPDIVQATPRQTFQAWPVRAHPVLFNDAHGRFRDPGREAIDQSVDALQCIAGIDFDRDGLLDVIRSTGSPPNSGMLWMHRNDGDNAFVEAGRIWYDHTLGTPRTLAVGDVDGDGWQDFYASSHTGQNLLFRNQGNGQFVLFGTLPVTTTSCSAAQFGDFDGDGDRDLVTARLTGTTFDGQAGPVTFWANDGTGHFTDDTAQRMPSLLNRCTSMAVFDLHGDGDLDLYMCVNWSPQGTADRLYVNDGAGVFTNQPGLFPPGTSNYSDYVAATDLTGDGLVDLALHRGASLRIWRSDASGAFTDVSAQWNPMGWGPYDVRPADVDLDGRMDLYVGIDDPAVMRNTGTSLQMLGNVSATVYPGNGGPSMAVVADFDGDRDVDVAYGVAGFASAQWNLRHHLALPLFAKPGASMPIKVYRTPGLATVPCLAAVATSFGRMRQETPVGTLWIDPFGPLDVQLALLPAPLGTADASLPIPGWYFLQGVELTVQALLFDSVSGLVLTNGVTTVIR